MCLGVRCRVLRRTSRIRVLPLMQRGLAELARATTKVCPITRSTRGTASIVVFTLGTAGHRRVHSSPLPRATAKRHSSTTPHSTPLGPLAPRRRAAGLSPVAPQTRGGRDERGHGVRDLRACTCAAALRAGTVRTALGASRRAARRRASPAARARAPWAAARHRSQPAPATAAVDDSAARDRRASQAPARPWRRGPRRSGEPGRRRPRGRRRATRRRRAPR